jgi:hypothetical protein
VTDLQAKMTDDELAEAATSHRVFDQDSYELAGSALGDVKAQIRLRTAERDNELSPLLVTLEEVKARHQIWLEPLILAEADLKAKMAGYSDIAKANGVSVERAAGTTTRTVWSAEVTDLRALVEAVASELAPLRYLGAVKKELSQTARAEKDDMDIPGVTAVSRTSISATSHT